MAIRMRRGLEADFDASKMLSGEWAVSTDTRYVRMCFAPGVVLRMATYDAFESDMQMIQDILASCQTIEQVVQRIGAEVNSNAKIVVEYTEKAKEYMEQAKQAAQTAQEVTNITYASKDRAGIVKPQDVYVSQEDGSMEFTRQTSKSTLYNSHEGGIKLIGLHGKSEQKQYSGKNLLPYPYVNTTKTVNGVSYTDNGDGTVTANGTSTANTAFYFTSQMLVEAGTYTFSIGTTLPEKAICYAYDIANSKAYAQLYLNNTSATFTITEPTYISFYIVVVVSGATYSNVVLKPQLELGNTASDYEPYVGGKASPNPDYPQSIKPVVVSEIKAVGKNLFNINGDVNVKAHTLAQATNMSTVAGNVLTSNADITLSAPCGQIIYGLKGKTITVSADVLSLGTGTSASMFVYENGRYISGGSSILPNVGHISFKYTCTSDVSVCAFGSANGTGAQFTNIQVEIGDTETEYEEYKESVVKLSNPITLNGIGESADELLSGAKRFKTVEFTGNEGWTTYSTTAGVYYLHIADAKIGFQTSLCTHFRNVNYAYKPDGKVDTYCDYIYSNARYFNTGFETVDQWKAYLAEQYANGTPVTLTYELAEPIVEELPEVDQIALHSLKSFDTVTYISTDSEVEPVIELEYGTSHVGALALENAELHAVNEILLGGKADKSDLTDYMVTVDVELDEMDFNPGLNVANANFASYIPSGYKVIDAHVIRSGSDYVVSIATHIYMERNLIVLDFYNVSDNLDTGYPAFRLICVRDI